jgi:N-acetylneuraminic acid mutarotase
VTVGRDGRIYVLGGADENLNAGPNNAAEAYDPRTRTWHELPAFPEPGLYRAAATTGLDGRIYLLGGVVTTGVVNTTVQAYDPSTNQWTVVAPMHTPRAALGAVTAPDGRIYAIGGNATSVPDYQNAPMAVLRSVEIYDPKTDTWSWGPSLDVARWGLSAVLGPANTIYAIGGSTEAIETTAYGGSHIVETYRIPTRASQP